jgi:DNA-binding MltR family transcriptional regulator
VAWILETQDEVGLFREIATHSDRVVGILAPVVLERRLISVIKSRWKDTKTRGGTLFGELFSANGELGNHDSRLRIGLAMGLFSSQGFEEMRYIVKIRNLFAHEPRAKDFAAQPIRDFIPRLKIIDRFPPPSSTNSGGVLSPGIDLSEAEDAFFGTFVEASGIADAKTPRNRFLRTVEVFSVLLLQEEMHPSNDKPYF